MWGPYLTAGTDVRPSKTAGADARRLFCNPRRAYVYVRICVNMVKCAYISCDQTAHYGKQFNRPVYCKTHMPPDHGSVKKKCGVAACLNAATGAMCTRCTAVHAEVDKFRDSKLAELQAQYVAENSVPIQPVRAIPDQPAAPAPPTFAQTPAPATTAAPKPSKTGGTKKAVKVPDSAADGAKSTAPPVRPKTPGRNGPKPSKGAGSSDTKSGGSI